MKKFVCLLVALMMLASCAFAQEMTRPSVTVADVVIPTNPEVNVGEITLVISLLNVQPETKEQVVVDKIVEHVQEKPIVELFTEETVAAVVEKLPETVQASNLVMDEIFVMNVENYETAYGDVETRFQFVTDYEEDTVLVAMIGVIGEDGNIIWIPMDALVVEGMVNIVFTQEILELVQSGNENVIMALLRADEAAEAIAVN